MAIRWGIIGCGDVCELKSGPGFRKARGSELAAVMRRDADKAADYAKRHGVAKWTDDAQAIIDDPDVDAVYVATPVGSHCEYALKVAKANGGAGKPCYVEKPMARSGAECGRMNKAFAEAGQPLFVTYYRRGLPRFVKARELIGDGALGEVTAVSYRFAAKRHDVDPDSLYWRLRAEDSGGGLFMDLGSHALDILDYMVGAIGDVTGFATNRATPIDVEDTVAMNFRYESGVVGCGLWNFASAVEEDVIEVMGTEARLVMSCFGNEPLRLERPRRDVELFDLPNPQHVQQPLIQSIVDQLHGHGESPSTGESAARTARVMDAAVEGYYGGRGDAFWERPETWPGRRGS